MWTTSIDPIQPLFTLSVSLVSEQMYVYDILPRLSSTGLPSFPHFSQVPFETGAKIFIHYHNPPVMSPEYIAI